MKITPILFRENYKAELMIQKKEDIKTTYVVSVNLKDRLRSTVYNKVFDDLNTAKFMGESVMLDLIRVPQSI